MSNPNNPFIPYLTEENNNNNKDDNENQNNNKEKNENNDISKILEEGNATNAIPPPAYNEIVKPEPTQPGFDYPSYPPPPFPATEMSAGENENHNYPTSNVHMNSNNRRGRRAACCCVGNSRRNKTCSCGWMIVLIIFIVLGVLSIVNNNACSNLTLGTNPVYLSFDAGANTIFRVDADNARILDGEIRVFQKGFNDNSQTVDLEVYTATTGITPKIETSSQGGIFELKISQPGVSIFNIPSRCMKSLINVYLPQQYPNTIQVKHQDITMETNVISYQQNISLITLDGDIRLNSITAQNLNIQTDDGNIVGSIASVSNEIVISTKDGDLNLTMGNPQYPSTFTPKFTILTNDGDILLNFQNSFSGKYNIQSTDGSIQIDGKKQTNQVAGAFNNGLGNLNIATDNGDVDVNFQAV
ncbi:hypothetical protein RclHR1_10380003 [Rhizophagus clarus]|uniref:DUF4097 domain-containing protein n=1 Tax=Rhizophagus clarus TaxID=94130 RepID=A0A2Z6Q1E0_9GLOM|nr:hypothetical protein RclHR1_10380003 [Rhizophagus clarus]